MWVLGGKQDLEARESTKVDRCQWIERDSTHEGPLAARLGRTSRKEMPELGQLGEQGPSHRVELVSRTLMPWRPGDWKVWAPALE